MVAASRCATARIANADPMIASTLPATWVMLLNRSPAYMVKNVAPPARRLDRQRLAGALPHAAEPAAVQPASRRRYVRLNRHFVVVFDFCAATGGSACCCARGRGLAIAATAVAAAFVGAFLFQHLHRVGDDFRAVLLHARFLVIPALCPDGPLD